VFPANSKKVEASFSAKLSRSPYSKVLLQGIQTCFKVFHSKHTILVVITILIQRQFQPLSLNGVLQDFAHFPLASPADTLRCSAPVSPADTLQYSAPASPADTLRCSAPVSPADTLQCSAPVSPADTLRCSAPVSPADTLRYSAPVSPADTLRCSAPVSGYSAILCTRESSRYAAMLCTRESAANCACKNEVRAPTKSGSSVHPSSASSVGRL
jgi:hypothetical protein